MYAPVVPSNPDQNEQSVFRPKRPKILPFGAAHTYMAYIREYSDFPSSPGPNPSHDCKRPVPGLKMGEENRILVRLMIQRTERHTSTQNF